MEYSAGYYTIVLTERTKEPHELVKSIFTDLWSLHIINVNILLFENVESGSSVFTFFPYAENYCDEVRPVLWDYFIDGHFTLKKEIFATKLDNFYAPPDVILTHFSNETTSPYMAGIEGILFRVLSRKLNFRPVINSATGPYLSATVCLDMVCLCSENIFQMILSFSRYSS